MAKVKKVINEGAESVVVLVTTDDGSRTITKRRRSQGKTQYPFEAFIYEKTKCLGAHVPNVVSVNDNELVMSAFFGETLDDQPQFYDDRILFDDIAEDLALNREIAFQGFGKAISKDGTYRGELDSWNDFLAQTFEKLCTSELLQDGQKSALVTRWTKTLPSIDLSSGMLVHGDFALSAIFVKDGIYEGIIDYGDAFIGDPLLDLAYFRFKEITKDYGAKTYSLLADAYSNHSGVSREYIDAAVEFYMIYWAVERIHTANMGSVNIDRFIDKTLVLIDELT